MRTSLPCRQRRIQDKAGNNECQNQARYKAKDGVRPGKGHDGQANVLGEQESGRLLSAASTVFDGVVGLEFNLPADGDARVRVGILGGRGDSSGGSGFGVVVLLLLVGGLLAAAVAPGVGRWGFAAEYVLQRHFMQRIHVL